MVIKFLAKRTSSIRGSSAGFTLIEMIIVVAVIVLISAIVLANNARFGGTVLLQSLAYDVALSARQAQVYGTAVVRFGSNNFSAPFGIHFDMGSPTAYLIFADVQNAAGAATADGFYQSAELVQTSTIGRGFRISQLCITAAGVEDCTATKLDIAYRRPEPDAYIRANEQSTLYQRGRVILISPRGDTLSVYLESNGQIAVH